LTAERGRDALMQLAQFRITKYPNINLMPRIWTLRDNVTAFDAAYIALAEILRAPLVTTDARIATAPGHTATVEVIGRSGPR
jgi:predicted nucleic acid-binding protein